MLPAAAVLPAVLIVALHTGAAFGDIVVLGWLLRTDATVLVTVFRANEPALRYIVGTCGTIRAHICS